MHILNTDLLLLCKCIGLMVMTSRKVAQNETECMFQEEVGWVADTYASFRLIIKL